ncbi:hypothetical protein [Streptomyces sp. NBC_01768]|uniref:hypothetical protein n=1 Tax=Streptomyces sp. NBC_01768 TaxID=2975938 RepID=UPI002DD8D8EA|nr:hypothetical protein [Streptomyces sp. NBC_01768]WSC31783.1 hypothetical protein OG902_36620 [Streptomyces sp. NBC_01768]
MPENGTSTDSTTNEGTTPDEKPNDTGATDQGSGDNGDTKGGASREDDLPEWARKELKSVRDEAARRRTEAKALKSQLESAKSPEDYAAIEQRAAGFEADLNRERLARKYDLPDVIAKRIVGATDDEREADAKALAAELTKTTAGPVSGGLDPTDTADATDPAALAAQVRRRRG